MTRSNHQSGPPVAEIIIGTEDIAVLDPPVPLIRSMLTHQGTRFSSGGPCGVRCHDEDSDLYGVDFRGRLAFASGLVPRVAAELQRNGYLVEIEELRRRDPQLALGKQLPADLSERDRTLLQAVAQRFQGQIEVSDLRDTMQQIVLLYRAFPKARLLIAVATSKLAWRIWHCLEEHTFDKVGLALGSVKRAGRRCLVGTFSSIDRASAGKSDMLLLPVAEEATGNKAIDLVVGMHARCTYAFVSANKRADRHLQMRLEQIAGPVIHRLARPVANVTVIMLPTPSCEVAKCDSPLEQKRALYWRNRRRNAFIARVARAVADQDKAALKRLGVPAGELRRLMNAGEEKIAVLVETREHGRHLRTYLSDWPLCDKVMPPPTEPMKKEQANNARRCVVTAVYAASESVPASLVIRATGTEWPLRMKQFPPRCLQSECQDIIVIDFEDSFARRALQDSRRRIQDYRRRDMSVCVVRSGEQAQCPRNS